MGTAKFPSIITAVSNEIFVDCPFFLLDVGTEIGFKFNLRIFFLGCGRVALILSGALGGCGHSTVHVGVAGIGGVAFATCSLPHF
jgi:hypothetical protein